MIDHTKLVRPEIATLTRYIPGKPIDTVKKEYGLKQVVKLASNENPLGPSIKAKKAVEAALDQLHIYPDGASRELKAALADKFGFDTSQIVVGSGLDEILRLIVQTFLNHGEEAVVSDLTFPVYAHSTKLMGGKAVVVPLREHRFDLPAMADAVTENTKLVFICNPNNPTGTIVNKEELDRFMDKIPNNVIVVLDEAYYEFVQDDTYPDGMDYLREGRTVIVLRTFSKIYGLAALRLGYAICPRDIADAINLMRPVFNASSLAQVAAIAALEDDEHVRKTVANNELGKRYLMEQFKRLGVQATPTHTNFIFVDLGMDAAEVFVELQKKGVIIRPSGPKNCVRVSIGTPKQNEKLISCLEEVINSVKEVKRD